MICSKIKKGGHFMNLFHLRYFVELAHTRHYTKAAEHLCIAQPSLSHAIHQLEAELGVPLFEKSGRNTALTCFGEQFLDCAENALKTLDSGIEMLRQSAQGSGTIRLGFLRVLGINWLPTLAEKFLARYKDTSIRFTFHTGVTSELLDGLKTRHFDLVFSSYPAEDKGFHCVPVAGQQLVLIVPKNHPLAQFEEADLKQTLDYPYIYFSPDSGVRYDIDRLFDKIGEKPRIAYETEEDQVIAGLTAQNFGISIVPEMDLLDHLEIKKIRIKNSTAQRNIYMVSNDQLYIPPAVENFRRFIIEELPGSFQTP